MILTRRRFGRCRCTPGAGLEKYCKSKNKNKEMQTAVFEYLMKFCKHVGFLLLAKLTLVNYNREEEPVSQSLLFIGNSEESSKYEE
jgi:hypothetical protein